MDDPLQSNIVAAIARRVNAPVKLDDSLALLGVDSVGMAELAFELERAYGVHLGDDIVLCDTVTDLVDYVRERLNSDQTGGSIDPRLPR